VSQGQPWARTEPRRPMITKPHLAGHAHYRSREQAEEEDHRPQPGDEGLGGGGKRSAPIELAEYPNTQLRIAVIFNFSNPTGQPEAAELERLTIGVANPLRNSVWCPRNPGVPGTPLRNSVWCPRNPGEPAAEFGMVCPEPRCGIRYSVPGTRGVPGTPGTRCGIRYGVPEPGMVSPEPRSIKPHERGR